MMNQPIMRKAARFLAPLALAEWGAILIYFYASNRLASYLHPLFRPLVLVTGILLFITAGTLFLGFDETADCDDEGCTMRHGKTGGFLSFVVLGLPIALAAKISPDGFGAQFVQARGIRQTLTAEAPAAPSASPAVRDDYRAVGILDLMLASQDAYFQEDFKGKRVGLTGQFFPQEATHFELVCTLITCCAVDAQLLGLRVETDRVPAFDKMAWMKVIGRVRFVKEGDHDVPVIAAEKITPIPSPKEPFVYGPSRPHRPIRPAHH